MGEQLLLRCSLQKPPPVMTSPVFTARNRSETGSVFACVGVIVACPNKHVHDCKCASSDQNYIELMKKRISVQDLEVSIFPIHARSGVWIYWHDLQINTFLHNEQRQVAQ